MAASLPPGMAGGRRRVDFLDMSAAVLTKITPTGSSRLLADVKALGQADASKRASASLRLEAALGRDLADRLVAALSDEPRREG